MLEIQLPTLVRKSATLQKYVGLRKKNPRAWGGIISKWRKQKNKGPPVYTLFNISGMDQTLSFAKVECSLKSKPLIFKVDSGVPVSVSLSVLIAMYKE